MTGISVAMVGGSTTDHAAWKGNEIFWTIKTTWISNSLLILLNIIHNFSFEQILKSAGAEFISDDRNFHFSFKYYTQTQPTIDVKFSVQCYKIQSSCWWLCWTDHLLSSKTINTRLRNRFSSHLDLYLLIALPTFKSNWNYLFLATEFMKHNLFGILSNETKLTWFTLAHCVPHK